MSDTVTGISRFITSVSLMQKQQSELQDLTQQNSTGLKSQTLAGYGTDAPKILNMNSSISETQGWLSNSKEISTTLTGYDTTLTQLKSDASQLQTTLQSFSAGGTNAPTSQSLSTLIKGLESDVGATLNTQVGDRYIYAGSRYSTAPVVDLTTLAVPTIPTALTLASGTSTPPTVPNYDAAYASGTPPGQVASGAPYYNQQQSSIADSQSLTYGVTSNDPAVQQLVYALKQAEGAVAAGSSTTASQFISNALSAVGNSVTGLTNLVQQNGINQNTVTNTQTVQTQSISTLQSQLGDLTQVDPATVATELTQLETQLQGTYKATATLLNLSLVNYLP